MDFLVADDFCVQLHVRIRCEADGGVFLTPDVDIDGADLRAPLHRGNQGTRIRNNLGDNFLLLNIIGDQQHQRLGGAEGHGALVFGIFHREALHGFAREEDGFVGEIGEGPLIEGDAVLEVLVIAGEGVGQGAVAT